MLIFLALSILYRLTLPLLGNSLNKRIAVSIIGHIAFNLYRQWEKFKKINIMEFFVNINFKLNNFLYMRYNTSFTSDALDSTQMRKICGDLMLFWKRIEQIIDEIRFMYFRRNLRQIKMNTLKFVSYSYRIVKCTLW